MNSIPGLTAGALRRLWPVWLLLLAGSSITVLLYFKALATEKEKVDQRLIRLAEHHRHSLTSVINSKIHAVLSMQTLFSFSDTVTRKEFEGASALVIKKDPDIIALEWIPIVSRDKVYSLEKLARKYGYADFTVKQLQGDGSIQRAAEDDSYYPILFVYPLEPNLQALGLDVKKLSYRSELNLAVKTGLPVCSEPVTLVQANERHDGWILSIPVFEAGHYLEAEHLTFDHQPAGFLQAVLHLEDLFKEAWSISQKDYVHISVDDITNPEKPIPLWREHNEANINDTAPPDAISESLVLPALQRTWQLTFRPSDAMLHATRTNLPILILIGGSVITGLIGSFVFHLLVLSHEIELQVDERTRDLSLANQKLNQEIIERQRSEAARLELEERLVHAQKMEAIGTLAGGIAHDFNNILTAILGYVELIKEEVLRNPIASEHIDEVQKASFRARDLVRQILTFSRQKGQELKVLNPGPVVEEAIALMRSTIPVSIQIQPALDDKLPCIHADPTQIHQIVVNLVTNAWHAIGQNNGRIEINLRHEQPAQALKGIDGPIPAGDYVCLSVKDNGAGIGEKTQERIFEPFFTTKETGKGSGMGLSLVHGIVRSHKGHITLDSTSGLGSRFQVYFPALYGEESIVDTEMPKGLAGMGRLIILIDDEVSITSLIARHLTHAGFEVKAFNESRKCLQYLQNCTDEVSLLISDSSMPEINGRNLLSIVKHDKPDLPVILYSGYVTEEDKRYFQDSGVSAILQKPVSFSELDQCIARLLP